MELSKAKLSVYSSLSSAKMRRRHGLFIAEGEKAVADTLGSFEAVSVVKLRGAALGFDPGKADVFETGEPEMKKISNLVTPSDVAGIFRLPEEEISLSADTGSLYLMLDGVRDPGNLGTILRTCHWFGVRTIFASCDSADVFNPKVVQATMGSLGHVKVIYCDLEEVIAANPGMPVYGTLLEGENIYQAPLSQGGFIVMGNEGKGISDQVKALLTRPLNIPPASSDHGESLNVAIATAVALSQFRCRQAE